jgi:hypothetical protein
MLASSARRALWLSLVAIAVLVLATPDAALAAPGGLVKAAARSTLGKIVLALTVLVFLPLIVWFLAKRAILVRRSRQALRQLGARVPHFAWLPLKERVTEVFAWVHSAWDQGKMDLAREYMTAWYVRNQQLQLDKWERDGLRNVTSDVKIKDLTPLYVSHNPGSGEPDRIVIEIEAEMRDYLVEKATGKVAQGDKTLGTLTSVWSFVHEDGRWLLSNIEPESTAFDYLEEASRVLAAQTKSAA